MMDFNSVAVQDASGATTKIVSVCQGCSQNNLWQSKAEFDAEIQKAVRMEEYKKHTKRAFKLGGIIGGIHGIILGLILGELPSLDSFSSLALSAIFSVAGFFIGGLLAEAFSARCFKKRP
jgi:hypothetical protein